MERQRSKVEWLREGDRNTGFCQAMAKARARGNKIHELKNTAGEMISEQDQLETMSNQFYQGLFMAQEELDPELVCDTFPGKLLILWVSFWTGLS